MIKDDVNSIKEILNAAFDNVMVNEYSSIHVIMNAVVDKLSESYGPDEVENAFNLAIQGAKNKYE